MTVTMRQGAAVAVVGVVAAVGVAWWLLGRKRVSGGCPAGDVPENTNPALKPCPAGGLTFDYVEDPAYPGCCKPTAITSGSNVLTNGA
ncbi:MAG TPA: hypothetical protein VGG32_00970 [Thermoplasmata archaeon]|jgi:hypothetical protein